MGKIIIDNQASITDSEALSLVKQVIDRGRISNHGKQYCYMTVFTNQAETKEWHVVTGLNKKSDRFVVYNALKNESDDTRS